MIFRHWMNHLMDWKLQNVYCNRSIGMVDHIKFTNVKALLVQYPYISYIDSAPEITDLCLNY